MIGKYVVGLLIAPALVVGAAIYYLQVYAYYEELPNSAASDLRLTTLEGAVEPLPVAAFKGIDSTSSPIRYRVCATTETPVAEIAATYATYPAAEPLQAPYWFDCFDARSLELDLESGTAVAYLGEENTMYGIDQVVAVYPDGRTYVWNQINSCGEVVFEGNAAPADCPEPPKE
jgi:uncharacterized protein DUF6446